MLRPVCFILASACLLIVLPAAETVATAVYSRVGNGYKRERHEDGSFKPEYYALANGGRIAGTMGDITVDRVTYPEVAAIAMRLLTQQNYHYAQNKEQATLLLVLQWGNTIAFNGTNYSQNVNQAASVLAELMAQTGFNRGSISSRSSNADGSPGVADGVDPSVADRFEMAMLQILTDNRLRDHINERNARVIGYLDELADSNDIRRWAGGGDRYNDLIADVEESRYYIVISAYDFREMTERNKKKLLWQTRVSVRAPGNRFDDSFAAMLKGASKYFGQDSGRLVRGEESKGVVEFGDLKFLGEVKDPPEAGTTGK